MGIGANLAPFGRSLPPHLFLVHRLHSATRAPAERKTRYTARLAQSENYGIAFGLTVAFQDTEHTLALQDADRSLVGDDSREILKDRRYRTDIDRAALIDLVIGHSPQQQAIR